MNSAYSLTNPLSLLLDKPSDAFTREDLLRAIEEKALNKITFHYTALDGKLKELKIPVVSRSHAERVLADGERVDGSSLYKGLVDTALSDLYVVPVYKSAFLNPFDEGSIDFTCRYLTSDGSLAPFTLDAILQRASNLFSERTGFQMTALGELEFFLVSDPPTRSYINGRQGSYHASGPFVKSGQVLDEMVREISRITGAVKYAHSEVGYVESVRSYLEEIRGKHAEQMEIEFLPRPIEEMGDYLVLARWLIRNIAYRRGAVATFTPKLEEGVAGNGLHVHCAMTRNGSNIMTDENGDLSMHARKMVGGWCTYADSLTAFGNTVSSAYLRLVPNQEAPTRICWSDMNRSAMIRVPLGWSKVDNLSRVLNPQQDTSLAGDGGRQTIELRSPDGSAMVHLLLAGIVMAAEWGLTHDNALAIAERHYTSGNIFQDEKLLRSLPMLPKSCVDSSSILLAKRELYEREGIFPPSVIEYVARMLQGENDRDINCRLGDLPADDRLDETRRIMHKDLHKH